MTHLVQTGTRCPTATATSHHPSPAALHPISLEEARPYLCPIPWPPELSITREREQTFSRLRGAAVYRLLYRDLASAVASLNQLVSAPR